MPPVVAPTVAEPESRRGIVPESLPRRRGSGRGLVGTFIPQLQSWYNTLDAQDRRKAERERMSADASKREAAMGTWAAENLNPSQQTLFAALSPDAQSTMLQGIAFPGAPPAEPAEAARVQLLRLLSESPEVIESLMGQGLTPSQILGGGGGTTVNVGDDAGSWNANEWASDTIKSTYDTYRTSLRDTHEGLSTLNLFEQLNAEVDTGPGAEFRQSATRILAAAGFPMSEGAEKTDVMQSMINNIVIPMAKQLGVNPTDRDMELLLEATVSLGNTPASNRLLIDIQKLMHARAQLISDRFNEHLTAGMEAEMEPWQIMQSWNRKLDDFTNYDSGHELWTVNANDIYNRARDVEGFVVPPTRVSVGSGGAAPTTDDLRQQLAGQ